MANLNFPDPTVVQTYTAAGITWTWNATKNVWSSELEGGGAGASVSVGDNPPADAEQGDMWWNSSDDSGRLYVYYEDTNSSQWVEASPQANGDDVYLSKVNNDTAAGDITFEGVTTHEGDVQVSTDSTNPTITLSADSSNPIVRVGYQPSSWLSSNDEGARIRPYNIRVHNPNSTATQSCISLRRTATSDGYYIDFLGSESGGVQGTIKKGGGGGGIAITGLSGGPLLRNGVDLDSSEGLVEILKQAYDTIQDLKSRIEELESNTLQPLYSTLADLPDASEHHGKTAHVHSEGALYFAHAGNWVKLQNA